MCLLGKPHDDKGLNVKLNVPVIDLLLMSSPARKMPMSSAMASAVNLLSPVIMITRTPAFVHSPMAAATCARAREKHGWVRSVGEPMSVAAGTLPVPRAANMAGTVLLIAC